MTTNAKQSRLNLAVSQAATRLQKSYFTPGETKGSNVKGVLAELRRNAGVPPQKAPLAFEKALSLLYPALLSEDDNRAYATNDELAAFDALTLFALHMQSATQPVHVADRTFARACGLMYANSESASLKPRFDALLTANSFESQLYHARSLVTLLRSKNLGFDYGAFAQDLKTLRNPAYRKNVLVRWGRDFAIAPFQNKAKTES